MANLHIVSECELNARNGFRHDAIWDFLSLLVLYRVFSHRYTSMVVAVHHCEMCPLRGFLSVLGLNLIYGGHNCTTERTGGAQAPSLTQPQVMANYIFISLWSGRTRTDLQPQLETNMDPNHLS